MLRPTGQRGLRGDIYTEYAQKIHRDDDRMFVHRRIHTHVLQVTGRQKSPACPQLQREILS